MSIEDQVKIYLGDQVLTKYKLSSWWWENTNLCHFIIQPPQIWQNIQGWQPWWGCEDHAKEGRGGLSGGACQGETRYLQRSWWERGQWRGWFLCRKQYFQTSHYLRHLWPVPLILTTFLPLECPSIDPSMLSFNAKIGYNHNCAFLKHHPKYIVKTYIAPGAKISTTLLVPGTTWSRSWTTGGRTTSTSSSTSPGLTSAWPGQLATR